MTQQIQQLSKRELEVVSLLAQDLSYEEIAQRLRVTPGTIYDHVWRATDKLGIRSRVGLAVWFVLRYPGGLPDEK